MAGKLTGTASLKVTRWAAEDWAWLAEVAKSVGLSRSDFVRKAAMAAATATANGMAPYFVEGPSGTRQNTRTNLLEQKSTSVEVRASGAKGVASAKRAPTKAPISRNPKG
ncbi:hypothetical protein GTP44_13925 [Duganella sp. FT50W]|uniref:Uncharacterized protein n=1 Tax=Duganella lactea TaxID=2692173 RepID=A0A6L8MIT1_9BURK|nr:hypothetical protein [Duganella lactea]MYM83050.1 hypothetical protein [Duganella lactea]